MKTYIKNLFKEANKKIHASILDWLDKPDYRAQLFVDDIITQIIEHLDKEEISYREFSDKVGKTRSAITQFLDSDAGISVKRLFEYIDPLDLTIEHPKLVKKNFESIYKEIEDSELEVKRTEFVDFEKNKATPDTLDIEGIEMEAETKRSEVTYQSDFYSRNRAS